MENRTSATARIAAALALVGAVLVLAVIVAAAMDGNSSSSGERTAQPTKKHAQHRSKAKTYTVESGDTLTAISHKTGVPVAEILALNPEVDPQILIAGQTLQLK
jgi:LysM repeat protein